MKTMLRLGAERDTLSVVNDQNGTPTNAVDLAKVLIKISSSCHAVPKLRDVSASQSQHEASGPTPSTQHPAPNTQHPAPNTQHPFGIFNFSNEGQCSWYDFAKKIFEIHKIEIDLQPIPTSSYPTPAKRPSYSVLDKSKIKAVFGTEISEEVRTWEESLKKQR
jgi:dTDP-4-dehydrorhamnose reductase